MGLGDWMFCKPHRTGLRCDDPRCGGEIYVTSDLIGRHLPAIAYDPNTGNVYHSKSECADNAIFIDQKVRTRAPLRRITVRKAKKLLEEGHLSQSENSLDRVTR